MLAAVAHRGATAYRCPQGCWWEKTGCYCPDGFQFRALRGLSQGLGTTEGVGTIVGLALVGALVWGAVGLSKVTKRARRSR